MTDDDPREASRSHWSAVAGGWAEGSERRESGPPGAAADWMLDAAQLAPGDEVLELACGAGDVGLRAAAAVGPDGRVVCSDFAEPMVGVTRERAAGLGNVEARVLDAEDPQLGDERFDAVLCRFGYMLMADPGRALRATNEALRPGGRVALAVWGPAESNPWLSIVTDALMDALDAPPPGPGTPGPFALGDRARLSGLLSEAGFDAIVVEEIDDERRHDSPEAWWATMVEESGPISALLANLDEAQVETIRTAALTRAQEHTGADGAVRFPARIVVASARH
jgi:SAM-dependent methyltransferase